MIYVDIPGLVEGGQPCQEYTEALQLEGTPVSGADRLALLAKLRSSVGVTVVTGPAGVNFWSLCSIEVKVRLVPDGTDYTYRTTDLLLWGLLAAGLDVSTAENMAKGYSSKAPTPKHQHYQEYIEAKNLAAELTALGTQQAIVNTEFEVEVISERVDQLRFLSGLQHQVALDYEWDVSSLNPIGLAVSDAEHNWYLPVNGGYESFRFAVSRLIHRIPTIWHNFKADLGTQYPGDPIEVFGCEADDILVMAYLLGEPELGLKPLTRKYLGRDPLDYPEGLGNLPVEIQARYAGADTRNTYDLYQLFVPRLRAMGRQYDVYLNIERPIIPILASMEKLGQPVDFDRMKELRENFIQMEEALRGFWWAREHLDIAHDLDVRQIVRRRTGYDPGSCKQDVLAKVEGVWMDSILAYRRIRHRRRSFLDKHIQRGARILRTEFNQAGSTDEGDPRSFRRAPRSGRLSSSGEAGNLQNQPGDIRSVFVAPPGYVLGVLDYSALELRTQAAVTGDPAMIYALEHADLHDDFRQRIIQLTKTDVGRTAAKNGNFNGAYGGDWASLDKAMRKQRAFLPQETLETIVSSRRKAYPVYYRRFDEIEQDAIQLGYADTYFGRRRIDADVSSRDRTLAAHVARSLVNHIVGQGTASDVMKLAMIRCVPVMQAYGAHLALQVHDELVFWLKQETAELALKYLKLAMESIQLPNGVSLKVDAHLGDTWEAAKG